MPPPPRPSAAPPPVRPLLVGVAWQGNPGHKGDRYRSVALGLLAPLAAVPGVRLVSLQKGHGAEQVEAHRAALNLLEWQDAADLSTEAMLDTAAALKCLDLVVCVDTSVAHLAGALGVPAWMMLPVAPDWRWLLDRADTPWYPTMRLFRQSEPGDWPGLVEQVAAALRERVARHQTGGATAIEAERSNPDGPSAPEPSSVRAARRAALRRDLADFERRLREMEREAEGLDPSEAGPGPSDAHCPPLIASLKWRGEECRRLLDRMPADEAQPV